MTFGLLRRSLSAVPLATGLLLSSFAANADTLTGILSLNAPQGNAPVGDHPAASGTGSFSFSSDLTNGLTQSGTLHVLASDLTSFNLTVRTQAASFLGNSVGPVATYNFGLADLTSIDVYVFRNANSGFYSPGFVNLATTAVAGSIPDYGLATITASNSDSPAGTAFYVSTFSYPEYPTGPLFPNGAYADGRLAISDNGVLTSSATATPEPGSFLLAAPALAGLWFIRRKNAA